MERHIHCPDPDETTLAQFEHCCSQDYVTAAALMPDAHAGYVAPIGAVLIARDHVVPAWVGYDIGCGMIAVKLSGKDLLKKCKAHREAIYERVRARIPMGMGNKNDIHKLTKETREDYKKLVERFAQGPHDRDILNFFRQGAEAHLGTLGGGNHFIELDEHDGDVWLVIHSGSRGVGYKVAQKYMQKSAGRDWQYEETHPLSVDSELGKEYLNILSFGLEFALLNRLE
ncbi:RtcB family protein, partial [Candidatus Woesearchaeota archaeon]